VREEEDAEQTRMEEGDSKICSLCAHRLDLFELAVSGRVVRLRKMRTLVTCESLLYSRCRYLFAIKYHGTKIRTIISQQC